MFVLSLFIMICKSYKEFRNMIDADAVSSILLRVFVGALLVLTSSQRLHFKSSGDTGGVHNGKVGHLLVQAENMV